jgi:polysaccharide biosynthesis transport protein
VPNVSYESGALSVPDSNPHYAHMLTDMLPILWRRRRLIFVTLVLTSAAGFLFYDTFGERYEAYTLLRVGQGIKDRSTSGPFGDGPDLTGRIESLARIAATDQVIRLAASQTGSDRLFKKLKGSQISTVSEWIGQFDFLQTLPAHFDFLKPGSGPDKAKNSVDALRDKGLMEIADLRGLITAKAEGRTDLLKISFRHRDPVIAAEFLNHLANALVATQADLVQVPGAGTFFQQQAKRLEAEAEKAATDLRNFSVAASIYSVADQRTLLLKRADDLGNLIAATRGTLEDRKGQKQAILDQLMILRPVYQSRTVTGIVNNLRGRDHKEVENSVGTAHNEEAPPLLLVKVYQDAMANLLKVNTELNGSLRVEKHLVSELEKVNAELASLSSREAEYDRLKRVLTRASAAADHYGSRVMEEDISQDIAKKTQLSSVRVVQLAEKSVTPVFPRASHIAILATVGGIALGSAFAVMLELARVRRRHDVADEVETANAIEEAVRRSVRGHLREIRAAE